MPVPESCGGFQLPAFSQTQSHSVFKHLASCAGEPGHQQPLYLHLLPRGDLHCSTPLHRTGPLLPELSTLPSSPSPLPGLPIRIPSDTVSSQVPSLSPLPANAPTTPNSCQTSLFSSDIFVILTRLLPSLPLPSLPCSQPPSNPCPLQ